MKQIVSTFLFLLAVSCAVAQSAPKQIPGTEGQKTHPEAAVNSTIPPFRYVTHQRKFITNQDIPVNKPVIMVLFNPTCDHCQKAAQILKDNKALFGQSTVVLVTFVSNFGELEGFVQSQGLAMEPNFFICAAEEKAITSYFMPNYILPQILVYNKQHKLKKVFYETMQADSVQYYMTKP